REGKQADILIAEAGKLLTGPCLIQRDTSTGLDLGTREIKAVTGNGIALKSQGQSSAVWREDSTHVAREWSAMDATQFLTRFDVEQTHRRIVGHPLDRQSFAVRRDFQDLAANDCVQVVGRTFERADFLTAGHVPLAYRGRAHAVFAMVRGD